MSKSCPDCNIKEGKYHIAGCDREVCSKCKRQSITCECKTVKIRVPFGFEPVETNKLWEEFICMWFRKDLKMNIPMCGLCGGNGLVTIDKCQTPDKSETFDGPKARPCICPNGRVYKDNEKKKGKP
jgi:hypothetical protein